MKRCTTDELQAIVGRMPTTRDEDWKYTDLTRARDISSRWLTMGDGTPSSVLDEEIQRITESVEASWLVVANGEIRNLATVSGVTVDKLDEAPAGHHALAELNAALLKEGLRIVVEGTIDKPIGILVIDGTEDTSVSQAYIEVALANHSTASVIEYHASLGDADQYANTVVSLVVGDGATANHVRVQNRARNHVQTGRTDISVGKDANFRSAGFDLGGGLIRNDIVINISNAGADVSFDGLYLAGEGQHIDNHTRVDHRVGPAISKQEYRGILNGKCRCIWNGKAIVHEGADGTDADQANHNLLLSDKAEIDAKPELEIYTDDVKCSHGTTVGQLDETSLFYLRSRGLDREHATQILTHAFAAGIVARAPVEAAKEEITRLMEARLARMIQTDDNFSS
ncbi:MAG: Fe-S cluster assembly protein SufD [Gammaproteobacteria bacterium]|jgi:Fe-S cluster assembly protein SufD|nr:Fe-S cluster assembly protein SufD [Gammaproteobacteria bacterium]